MAWLKYFFHWCRYLTWIYSEGAEDCRGDTSYYSHVVIYQWCIRGTTNFVSPSYGQPVFESGLPGKVHQYMSIGARFRCVLKIYTLHGAVLAHIYINIQWGDIIVAQSRTTSDTGEHCQYSLQYNGRDYQVCYESVEDRSLFPCAWSDLACDNRPVLHSDRRSTLELNLKFLIMNLQGGILVYAISWKGQNR